MAVLHLGNVQETFIRLGPIFQMGYNSPFGILYPEWNVKIHTHSAKSTFFGGTKIV